MARVVACADVRKLYGVLRNDDATWDQMRKWWDQMARGWGPAPRRNRQRQRQVGYPRECHG
eukprot:5017740-Pyramimonas_sp.AAC.1